MTLKRSMAAGFTDYTGASREDILVHILDWKNNTDEAIALLSKHLKSVVDNCDRIYNPDDVKSYINYFIDLFKRYSSDFSLLLKELPVSIEARHVEMISQIYRSSKSEEPLCRDYKRTHISRALKDESLRYSLIDQIYVDTRGMIDDYLDLSNLAYRLTALIGSKNSSNAIGTEDIDILEIKPNFFGIGINFNHLIKRIVRYIKGK